MYKIIKLSDIATVISGQSPESIYYSDTDGTPFLQGNRTFGLKYPSIDTYTTKVTKLAPQNSILMSVRAPVGDLNIAPFDLCIGRGLASISANNNDNESLYYILKYNIKNLLNKGNGTTFDSVNRDTILDFDLVVPKDDYSSVTKILQYIDKKIELNNKINSELENLAKILYDYWFVQFDFPDEKERPYKSSGGAMVYNNVLKREIPVGWSNCTLNDICEMYQPQTLQEDNLIDNGQFFVYGANGIIGKYNEYNHTESEIAIACRGNSCGVLNRTLPNSWITGNAMVIKLKDKEINNEYLYHALNYTNIKGVITGSGQPQITRVNLAPVKIIKPSRNILLKYCSYIEHNVRLRLKNELENQSLKSIRDLLLPMLMNGQVTIRQ